MLLAADVSTDKFDYAPGSTAIISTFSDGGADRNFLVGETVRFQVVRTDGIADRSPGNLPWQVTDGVGGFAAYTDEAGRRIFPDIDAIADGRIATTWFVDPQYSSAGLRVTATGLVSGEQATEHFRDSPVPVVDGSFENPAPSGNGYTTFAGRWENGVYVGPFAGGLLEKRRIVLEQAYAMHPERFVRGVPRPLRPAAEVWINPPEDRAIRRTIQLQRDTDFVTQVSQSH